MDIIKIKNDTFNPEEVILVKFRYTTETCLSIALTLRSGEILSFEASDEESAKEILHAFRVIQPREPQMKWPVLRTR